ncbi:electron transfer flavoprotein subunit beta/FixA family protein [Georgenia sp. SYP-B2076]|uniref:electron transfer flavoprotein subunit beta/FixA family protein n=1 Tax=Georgenia sp. SYP-B2076 TaxID=2495881 RepID=UPI000F8DDDC1|nr:electron transfer flavoprotein subunit beta/FixA family protein [Georgenia sp. SYP-B2076]
MKILVLVKYVPDTEEPRRLDTVTGEIDRADGVIDEITSRALAWALETRDAVGGEVVTLTVGPDDAMDALKKTLAIGADEAVHVLDDAIAGSDAVQTSAVLAGAARATGFDLVVAGAASTDGQVGAVPAMLAERLGVPHLTYLTEATVTGTGVSGRRDAGSTTYEVAADLPAVVSVTEKAAEPRVASFRGVMGAKRKPKRVLTLADLGLETAAVGAANAAWTITSVAEKPPRARGDVVTDDGDAARRIADFLAEHQLIGK